MGFRGTVCHGGTMIRILFVASTVLVADQATKFIVQHRMSEGMSIPVVPEFFHLTYILNPGAAFGLFVDQQWLFILVALLLIGCVVCLSRELSKQPPLLRYGAALLVGGAIGNLIDRVRLGKVVDFFDFRIWPIFNVADIAICVGVGLILLAMFKDQGEVDD